LLLDFKIAHLPEYFCPYAKLHYKRAYKNELPESVRCNEKHMFHLFHHIGYQKFYVSNSKKFLKVVLDRLQDQFEAFEDEQHRFEKSAENFYNKMEMTEDEIYNFTTKKIIRSKKIQNYIKICMSTKTRVTLIGIIMVTLHTFHILSNDAHFNERIKRN